MEEGMLKTVVSKCAVLMVALLISEVSVWAEPATMGIPVTAVYPSLIHSVRPPDGLTFLESRVPLDSQDVRERLEKEMLLALWDRPQVILWIKRASKYFSHIEAILKEEGLPDDLKYIAVVESGLRPHAGSSAGAIGFWQFLPSTGRKHGLQIDSTMDERRNLFKSTRAACRYLKALFDEFKSWPLALAAYNMGENGLASEIEMQETDDFYALYLPLETQRYLFKIIAAKRILENPEMFGFSLEPGDLYPSFAYDTVTLSSPDQVPLSVIAKAAGVSFKTVKDMNPDIRGYYLGKGKHLLMIPRGSAKTFKIHFRPMLETWRSENNRRVHVVKPGENLSLIAKAYDVSLTSLLLWNNLSMNSFIHPGETLVVYPD